MKEPKKRRRSSGWPTKSRQMRQKRMRKVGSGRRTEQAVDASLMGQQGHCHTRGGAHGVLGLDTPELQRTLFGHVWQGL